MVKSLGDRVRTRPPGGRKTKKSDEPWTVIYGKYMALTSQNISFLVAGGLLGWYLDKRFHTYPGLLITGIFLGAAAGMFYLIRSLNVMRNNKDHE